MTMFRRLRNNTVRELEIRLEIALFCKQDNHRSDKSLLTTEYNVYLIYLRRTKNNTSFGKTMENVRKTR